MRYRYFKADLTEIDSLSLAPCRCPLCLQIAPCIDIGRHEDYASWVRMPESAHAKGCLLCLQEGAFHVEHHVEPHSLEIIPDQLTEELYRTPSFRTWSGATWLTHCNDYMAYLGVWKEADFKACAGDLEGFQLFQDMTAPELHGLWSNPRWGRSLSQHALEPTYYAFQCLHCMKLRGYWDSP